MIELNEKTKQDFLSSEWVQKLHDAGIDMYDAKYMIFKDLNKKEYIVLYSEELFDIDLIPVCPTYSTAELLYKLNEYPSINIGEELIGGPLKITKDAPFYIAGYYFGDKKYDIECVSEYPIETLAQLLICSAKSNFYNFKYVSNISDKLVVYDQPS